MRHFCVSFESVPYFLFFASLKDKKFINPAQPFPNSDIFLNFPEFLRSRNHELKTAHNVLWGCLVLCAYLTAFPQTAVYSKVKFKPLTIPKLDKQKPKCHTREVRSFDCALQGSNPYAKKSEI